MYALYKFLHVLGVVLLIGNVTVTSVWKVFADRTARPETIAFAQRLVAGTDWAFTGGGAALVIVGGYGMAFHAGIPLVAPGWMFWSQVAFVASGALWLGVLLPIQIRQGALARGAAARAVQAARAARAAGCAHEEPDVPPPPPAGYRRLARAWIAWGVIATLPLVAALWMMLTKTPR